MMRYCFMLVWCALCSPLLKAQQIQTDSLQVAFQHAPSDSVRFKISRSIYTFYEETNRDSALRYATLRYDIAKKHRRTIEAAYLQGQMAYQQIYLGRFSEALTNLTEALQIASNSKEAETWELTTYTTPGQNRQICLSMLNHMYGHLKLQTGSKESLHYFKEGRRIGLEVGNNFRVTVADMVLATNYLLLNNPDSAFYFAREGEQFGIAGKIPKYLSYIWSVMGDVYLRKGMDSLAIGYYHKSLQSALQEKNATVAAGVYENLINYYQSTRNTDSLLYYAQKNLSAVKSLGAVTSFVASEVNLGKAYQQLAIAYSMKKNIDSSNKYLQLALTTKDSLTRIKLNRLSAFQRLTLDEQIRLQQAEKKRIEAQNRQKIYLLVAGIGIAVFIGLLIYRNNLQKQKDFERLQEQKAATDEQKEKADAALLELTSTQTQLIHAEKMASLGELTAGIAHEIQNPLNFVNNFSELSSELMQELTAGLESGDVKEVKALAADIKQNLEKITHHGKRADAIVKGMLQHSRTSSGLKEPTNLNALCTEYIRLCYHGQRGKDNTFNVIIEANLDESIGLLNIIPQEIGRVLLNLLTNACYAVLEKKRSAVDDFTPKILLRTKKLADNMLITVSDNGNGIPEQLTGKIFQPFFTTKPTGQGTGLGLSLSYDIVTKGHGGQLNMQTKEGIGTEFSIILPGPLLTKQNQSA